jgi:hypothetical protein
VDVDVDELLDPRPAVLCLKKETLGTSANEKTAGWASTVMDASES